MERSELDVFADENLDYSLKLAIARDLGRTQGAALGEDGVRERPMQCALRLGYLTPKCRVGASNGAVLACRSINARRWAGTG